MKRFLSNKFESWHLALTKYRHKVYAALFKEKGGILLGLGCSSGELTCRVGEMAQAGHIIGIDKISGLSSTCREKMRIIRGDLDQGIPLRDGSVDMVSGDQIIEHLYHTDLFVQEIYRVLKPGGCAVICTENLASLHNLFALILGKQAFSQFVSSKYRLGNSLSPHYKQPLKEGYSHVQIFTVQGLKDIFEIYNFKVEEIRGIIYFPFLPFWSGRLFEIICPCYAHFIAIRVRKPRLKNE